MNNIQNNILRVLIFLIFFSVAVQGALSILGKKLPEYVEHYVNLGTLACLVLALVLILVRVVPSLFKKQGNTRKQGKKK